MQAIVQNWSCISFLLLVQTLLLRQGISSFNVHLQNALEKSNNSNFIFISN